MAHSRDRGNKEKRREPKQDKKRKGLPPHLQRTNTSTNNQNGSLREIQRHINELEEKQK